ncbi:unnamed protein product [Plutella xylostella]|uniref:(diamondback moth) hypothetical protein n=1 Tax=Plutella xylostella TaxID=51655 RepID=A0A8S4F0C1_PLUXY|nr:unnamed protein product [Plutella xylostella]
MHPNCAATTYQESSRRWSPPAPRLGPAAAVMPNHETTNLFFTYMILVLLLASLWLLYAGLF